MRIASQTRRFISFEDFTKALESVGNSQGLSLSLSHLTDCIVDFRGVAKALIAISATSIKGSVLLLPSVFGSIMLNDLEKSVVTTGVCRQFRVSSSQYTSLLVNASSPVTIESCSDIKISSTSGRLLVQDFDAPGAGPSEQPTKSWEALSSAERAILENFVASLSETNASEAGSLAKLPTILPAATASPYRGEENGVLLVFSDPGQTFTLEEFHDWYNNEHVPMRTEVFDEFCSAARYSVPISWHARPGVSPAFQAEWAAIYVISSNSLYENPEYVMLRSKRSPYEAEVLARLGVLDRRIYKTIADSSGLKPVSKAETEAKARRVEYLAFSLPIEVQESDVAAWFRQTVIPTNMQGLTRIKIVKLIDALFTGKEVTPNNGDSKDVASWALLAGKSRGGTLAEGSPTSSLTSAFPLHL